MSKSSSIALCCVLLVVTLAGCSEKNLQAEGTQPIQKQNKYELKNPVKSARSKTQVTQSIAKVTKQPLPQAQKQITPYNTSDSVQVVAQPDSIQVLVNKHNKLPDNFIPKDLVYVNIPFIFSQKSEKEEMRKEAATAIEQLFTAAKTQGVRLLGVSAYRSYVTQESLFNMYVNRDGYQKAITYSALPGTSEHETGLAIDVTGGNGQCAAEDCFGNTTEATWLQTNAAEFGFIIRYPKGKEAITGYQYEPWHLRYVGKSAAEDIMSRGITLEEYYHAIPVNNSINKSE